MRWWRAEISNKRGWKQVEYTTRMYCMYIHRVLLYLYSVSSHEFDASAYFQKTRVKANSLQTNSSSSPHIRIHRFRCYWGERGGGILFQVEYIHTHIHRWSVQ